MLRHLAERARTRRAARNLYGAIVAQSRSPGFYGGAGVPDAMDSRFEMLVMHLFLVQARLRAAEEGGGRLGLHLAEEFVAEMDSLMREIGIGDTRVGARVKEAAAAYNGRLRAYDAAVARADDAELATVIGRHVLGAPASDPRAGRLAAYMREAGRMLAATGLEQISAGTISFPSPVAAAEVPRHG